MMWFWAAYEQGMWREFLPGGMSIEAFTTHMMDMIGTKSQFDWIIEAQGDDGHRPVGLVLGRTLAVGENVDQTVIEPFVQWFPWATPRNQIEGTAVFLKEASKQFKIFVFAMEDAIDYWSHFVRYGMVRRGCKIIDYFSRGEHAMLFYTVNK